MRLFSAQEEGSQPGNRLSEFARLMRDKGGLFAQALVEAKEGTLLAPSNEAFARVDRARFDFILGDDYLRAETLGLHFVRDRIISTDKRILAGGDRTFSSPASLAANRIWFHFDPLTQRMTVEGRGVNASVVEKDIGTINGVIHVVDRILGVPHMVKLLFCIAPTRPYLLSDDNGAFGIRSHHNSPGLTFEAVEAGHRAEPFAFGIQHEVHSDRTVERGLGEGAVGLFEGLQHADSRAKCGIRKPWT